jgi:predicted SAM-dependent methyltransferase
MVGSALHQLRHLLARSDVYLRFRDFVVRAGQRSLWVVREDLARQYLVGDGIEIGALTLPLRVPAGVRVRYIDRMSRAALLRHDGPRLIDSGLDPASIPDIDVVDRAETLASFADQSLDFVIANHVLEHVEDPIGALENLLRVIRPGGVLFLTLPDARHTFDARRSRTTTAHLIRDHREGPAGSRREHYEEWARLIDGTPEQHVADRMAVFARDRAHHHFHVWELEDFLALLRAVELPYDLLEARAYFKEFAVLMRRTEQPQHGG